jgi:hypothetical protein
MDFSLFEDLLKAIPFVIALSVGVFRIDQLFFTPVVKPQRASRSFCGYQASDRFAFSDPDGRDNRRNPRA